MRIKRLLLTLIISLICITGLSKTAYADTINADGYPGKTGYMPEGITVGQGGSLVYLVDPDGNYAGYSESFLYANGSEFFGVMSDAENMITIHPRVSGISDPGSCEYEAPWGPSYGYDGSNFVNRDNEIKAYFAGIGKGGKTKGYNFIADKWNETIAKEYADGELAIAIELVTSCRFGYQCVYRTNVTNPNPTPSHPASTPKEALNNAIIAYVNDNHINIENLSQASGHGVTLTLDLNGHQFTRFVENSLIYGVMRGVYSEEAKKAEQEILEYLAQYAGGGEGTDNSEHTGQVYHYFTNGVKRVIGTPRNIEKYYRENGGMTKESGKFGYKSYRSVMAANNATSKGFPADTLAVVSWFGFSDGRLGSYPWTIVNSAGTRITVANTNGSQFTHGFNGSGGWKILLKCLCLKETVSNLSVRGVDSYAVYGSEHSAEGIMLVFSDTIPEPEPEDPKPYDYLLTQSQLADKVDLLNDINGRGLFAKKKEGRATHIQESVKKSL